MNELLFMLLALITGGFLGMLFFGGLWLTVRKAMASNVPALWFLGSVIFRTGIVLAGFYLVMQQANWLAGLICLIGFIAARFIVFRLTKAYELNQATVHLAASNVSPLPRRGAGGEGERTMPNTADLKTKLTNTKQKKITHEA